jgi:branched-subunit amino acid aminotransferase/4-amino-4-deoxychorismate lyase
LEAYIFSGLHCFVDYEQVPPPGKGSLYIRPLIMGSGEILGLGAAPEYTFLIYVSPVGNYFKVKRVFCLSIKAYILSY